MLAGANPKTRDFNGNTALHLACVAGDINCVRALSEPFTSVERTLVGLEKQLQSLPQDLEVRNYVGELAFSILFNFTCISLT